VLRSDGLRDTVTVQGPIEIVADSDWAELARETPQNHQMLLVHLGVEFWVPDSRCTSGAVGSRTLPRRHRGPSTVLT
jgi:hypothetical protein